MYMLMANHTCHFSTNTLYIILFLDSSLHIFIMCRYDHPQIIAGQGTVALEILEQVQDVDAVIVPTGGGGLLAGVAVAIKALNPHIKVVVSRVILRQ